MFILPPMNNNEIIFNMILSNEAQERFKRIKTYHKTKGSKIEQCLLKLYTSGHITRQISDDDFLKLISTFDVTNEEKDVIVKIDRRKRDWDLDDI